ncbi:thrombomodulin [Antennarius striatus]|uniref:thrombomodulin n=1 Tax=Antennarius striatus TaxID=241820 RepID=UPI0035AE41CF
MKDVTGLLVILSAVLMGTADRNDRSGGYCMENQCFTVTPDPSDFKTAEKKCNDQGGHLMTVRSTDSRDLVFILLALRKDRFWIGLHRTADCPDAAANNLRGFQWVTGDSDSDFSNWSPSFDSSCSSHRCVYVSSEDLKWTQAPCDQAMEGFLCEHSFKDMCGRPELAPWEEVMYTLPMGFDIGDTLTLPPGSIATKSPSRAKFICFSKQWLPAPWSCEIQEGGCEYKCLVDPQNGPSCYCPPGQTVSPRNKVTCKQATDDHCLALQCAHACYKNGDSHACTCDHGFKLAQDGRSCVDINDCADERQCPRDNFVCVNTVGGFQCVCKDGFKLTGDQCVDVDECMSAPCEHMCTNIPGGFLCSCYDGYKEDQMSPTKCKLYCGDEECVAVCDPNDNAVCFCPMGYVIEERTAEMVCLDIDECASDYCDQDCENTFGSYVCSCSPGYTLVKEYKCVKNDDDTDADGGAEGSGASTTPNSLLASTQPPVPHPEPTRRPSRVTVGGLVGIIVATVFVVVLVVFLVHYFFNGRRKTENADALKASELEAHSLGHLTGNT